MTAEELLTGRERSPAGLFWVPSIGKRFEYYYKKRLDKGVLEKSHLEYLAKLFAGDPSECSKVIARLQPKSFAFVCSAFTRGSLGAIQGRSSELKLELRSSLPVESLWTSVQSAFSALRRTCSRIFQPTGFAVRVEEDTAASKCIIEQLRVAGGLKDAFRGVEFLSLNGRESVIALLKLLAKITLMRTRSRLVVLIVRKGAKTSMIDQCIDLTLDASSDAASINERFLGVMNSRLLFRGAA
mgnify:CR=1 FL=1